MYLTPGRNPTIELLRSSVPCLEVLIEQGIKEDDKIQTILQLARAQDVKVTYISHKQLTQKVPADTPHQGVISIAKTFSPELDLNIVATEKLTNQMYIYIREALYEHNSAAIIRTAECLGISGVILPPKLNISPNLTRIAMGANFHLPMASLSLFNAIKAFKSSGYQIAGIEINGTKTLYEADLTIPTLAIVGGEDRGLSPEIQDQLDEVLLIPQTGKVNSLNMSVAASLLMYEHIRQLKINN